MEVLVGSLDRMDFEDWHNRFLRNRCVTCDVEFVRETFVGKEMHRKFVFDIKRWNFHQPAHLDETHRSDFGSISLHGNSRVSFHHIWYFKDDHWEETEQIKRFMVCDHNGEILLHPMHEDTNKEMGHFVSNLKRTGKDLS